MIKNCMMILLLILVSLYAHDQIPAEPQSQPIALVGADIYPVSGAIIEQGTLFDDGTGDRINICPHQGNGL